MPADGKVCTFDCVYCECGFNADFRPHRPRPSREEVRSALEAQLQIVDAKAYQKQKKQEAKELRTAELKNRRQATYTAKVEEKQNTRK